MLPFMHNAHFHPAARPLPGVGILYESEEWSSHALESQARACGLPAFLVNLETVDNLDVLAACGLVVNRIFASSWCRGHRRSLERMPEVFAWLQERRIPVINSPAAHFYEIDKDLTTRTLLAAKRAGNLLKRIAPQKYEGILREIDRISRLGSIAQQAESLQQLLQGSGVIFRLLSNGFRATKP